MVESNVFGQGFVILKPRDDIVLDVVFQDVKTGGIPSVKIELAVDSSPSGVRLVKTDSENNDDAIMEIMDESDIGIDVGIGLFSFVRVITVKLELAGPRLTGDRIDTDNETRDDGGMVGSESEAAVRDDVGLSDEPALRTDVDGTSTDALI